MSVKLLGMINLSVNIDMAIVCVHKVLFHYFHLAWLGDFLKNCIPVDMVRALILLKDGAAMTCVAHGHPRARLARSIGSRGFRITSILGNHYGVEQWSCFFSIQLFFFSIFLYFFLFQLSFPPQFYQENFFFFYSCSSCFWQLIRSHILILILITSNTRSWVFFSSVNFFS
jgi:hypothetical protein